MLQAADKDAYALPFPSFRHSVIPSLPALLQSGAGLTELGAFPTVGEVCALRGFDGLDAAGVIRLQENATAVFLLNQRQIVAVECEHGVLLGERINVQPKERRDGFRLALDKRDISRHTAARAATLASEFMSHSHSLSFFATDETGIFVLIFLTTMDTTGCTTDTIFFFVSIVKTIVSIVVKT